MFDVSFLRFKKMAKYKSNVSFFLQCRQAWQEISETAELTH
ncbi:hypothetical protein GNIT_3352 [Glaciecola nitratireducens FR1064]|uniref:Uncharacterized protein n=1 Tax=Glaciecola nitratireducens (strain JCM 12485 / KCTC 12276 / FR1064) TaxID=1085623 RepID=G4QN27_GLANF|nr:hypothetical protein GNIT_3352 [Glaciecola nitratireducens FR1064]